MIRARKPGQILKEYGEMEEKRVKPSETWSSLTPHGESSPCGCETEEGSQQLYSHGDVEQDHDNL